MAVDELVYTGRLTQLTCWCSITFAVPETLAAQALHHGKTVHCPLGHTCVWKQTEADRLRAQLDQANARARNVEERRRRAEADAQHERNRANGYKGQLTKVKKRIGRGVCPCCNRHFADVERHMANKHPDLAGIDS